MRHLTKKEETHLSLAAFFSDCVLNFFDNYIKLIFFRLVTVTVEKLKRINTQ